MAAAAPKSSRGHRPGTSGGSGAGADFSLEEEDTTSGDLLDNVTPRDISRMRYHNHHEWMEEIFASPYRISQIAPVDLGLGRKGELENVTRDFFHAPTQGNSTDSNVPAANGKLEKGKAGELTDAMNRKIGDMTADMDTMKESHARKLDQLRNLSVLKDGELKLRDAVADPSDSGSEFWRLEGQLRLDKEENAPPTQYDRGPKAKVDDVVGQVEQAWGQPIRPVTEVVCVDRGGLQEKVDQPEHAHAQDAGTADVDMGDGSAGPGTGQQQTPAQPAPSAPEPKEATPESGKEPAPPSTVSEVGAAETNVPQNTQETKAETSGDIEMGGMQAEATGGSGNQEAEDWVVVDKEGNEENAAEPSKPQPSDSNSQGSGGGGGVTATSTPGKTMEGLTPGPGAGAGTEMGGDSGLLETSNFDDLSGFNSAGEALAAYGEQNDELDLGGLDDSAFGDAFHGSGGEHVHHDTDDIP